MAKRRRRERDRVARSAAAGRAPAGRQGGRRCGRLRATDILRHRFGGDVEQRVAGEIAAFGRQFVDGVGDQLHGALQVGDALGSSAARSIESPRRVAGGGPSLSPALPSATAKAFSRMAATREAVGAIMTSSDAINGPSKSPCARPHSATRVASSRLTLRAGRQVDLHGAARAEQEGVHGDGKVGQHLEQARHLEAAMRGSSRPPARRDPAAIGAAPTARSAR